MAHQDMVELLDQLQPLLVLDATHPYATQVSANIETACAQTGTRRLRVLRPSSIPAGPGVHSFDTLPALIDWVNTTTGTVFAAIGAKHAAELCRINDFANRIVLRLLPQPDGLAECLRLGYREDRLIGIYGPFSEELNVALFREFEADILLTKESGPAGGFAEKLAAANRCGMQTAVFSRPPQGHGVSLEQAQDLLTELAG
jgi:precorrin-6x reductase